jgi:DNA end-binding protein Ku
MKARLIQWVSILRGHARRGKAGLPEPTRGKAGPGYAPQSKAFDSLIQRFLVGPVKERHTNMTKQATKKQPQQHTTVTAAREIGTATISLGLVSVPIKIFTTSETASDLHFNMLHSECGSRLKQLYSCVKCNVTVDREHTVRGYEHRKGEYVRFTADELKALDAVATNAIELQEFVPASAIDMLYVEKSYYLGPDKGGERAYKLIRDAMLELELVGVASYSARGKQHIVSLRPFQEGMILHQLRYAHEVKDWVAVPLPSLPEIKPAELALAKQIIRDIAHETFQPGHYKDEVQERMLALINQKIDGNEITAPPNAPAGKVIDLMEALRASLGQARPAANQAQAASVEAFVARGRAAQAAVDREIAKAKAEPVPAKSTKQLPRKRDRKARVRALNKNKKRKAS